MMAQFKRGDQVVIICGRLGHQGEKGTILAVFETPPKRQTSTRPVRFLAPKASIGYYGVHLESNFPGDYGLYADTEIARAGRR